MVRPSKENREMITILHMYGYTYARTNGSHTIYINRTTRKHKTINRKLNRMVKERLIKELETEAGIVRK